jgi:uncharacterized membrane protein
MGKIFSRGLMAITPLALTVALIIWIFWILENSFSVPIKAIIGSQYYFPGLGIIVALIFIFFIGTIINNWVIQKLYQYNDRIWRKIPLIKTIYNSISDVVQFFNSGQKEKLGHVVMLEVQGCKLLGFVTREQFSDMPAGIGEEDTVAVYVPFSYQIGGYTVIVPRKQLKEIEISIEEAMRFTITAGILKDHKKSNSSSSS